MGPTNTPLSWYTPPPPCLQPLIEATGHHLRLVGGVATRRKGDGGETTEGERDANEGERERRVRAAPPSAAATAVVPVFSFCSDEFRFGYYGSPLVQVNGQNFDRTRVSCGDFSSTWFQIESRFSLIPVDRFVIRVRYGSYLCSSLQPVSVQVSLGSSLGRCFHSSPINFFYYSTGSGHVPIGFGSMFRSKQSTVGSNLVKAGQPSSRCSRVTGSGHRVKHET
ncbi:hypothetical protein HanIR_Chr04g0171431 [Helianthus annuus]|nr:hypothetical protein HanIR_Chr04g0171431 [Helianthus annuus]